jgi:hypothetical protein
MSVNSDEKNDWSMMAGLAVGAVIAILIGPPLIGGVAVGLCLGLLFSPKSGRETRQGIVDWVKRLGSKTKAPAGPEPDRREAPSGKA